MTTARHRKHYILVLILAAVVYYLSVAPGVLWQDSGLAQLRVLRGDFTGQLGLALAHPLYYMVASAFQYLPFADSAFKTNLVSPTCAAVTVANVYLLLVWLLPADRAGRWGAGIGTAAVALAHTFWQHAALAEVYTLTTCILTFELLALTRFAQTGSIRWYLLGWFLNGLECSNHMLAVLTAAAVVVWSVVLIRQGRIKPVHLLPAVALWLVGNLPYEYLGYVAWQGGESLGAVVHSMLFGRYRDAVFNLQIDKRLLLMAGGAIVLNFPTPNILLIPAGLVKAVQHVESRIILLLILATTFHLAFAVRYNVPDVPTFFIVPTLLLTIWLAAGASWLIGRKPRLATPILLLALTNPLVYACLPTICGNIFARYTDPVPYRNEATYFFWPWKTGYTGPQRFAHEVFTVVPQSAIVIADDTTARPVRYYQEFQHRRIDVHVVADPCKNTPPDQKPACLEALLRSRPVFVARPARYRYIRDHFTLIPTGCIYKVASPAPTKPLTQTVPVNTINTTAR